MRYNQQVSGRRPHMSREVTPRSRPRLGSTPPAHVPESTYQRDRPHSINLEWAGPCVHLALMWLPSPDSSTASQPAAATDTSSAASIHPSRRLTPCATVTGRARSVSWGHPRTDAMVQMMVQGTCNARSTHVLGRCGKTLNQRVAGSSPAGGTFEKLGPAEPRILRVARGSGLSPQRVGPPSPSRAEWSSIGALGQGWRGGGR